MTKHEKKILQEKVDYLMTHNKNLTNKQDDAVQTIEIILIRAGLLHNHYGDIKAVEV